MASADMSNGPAPDGEPEPQVHIHVSTEGLRQVRFHCTEPDTEGNGRNFQGIIRLNAEWLWDSPQQALLVSVIGGVLMTALWLLFAAVVLIIPFIGWAIGLVMMLMSPLGPFVFGYDIWRNYNIVCQWCDRVVHVGVPMDWTATCACGAKYRNCTMFEFPRSERNSNV